MFTRFFHWLANEPWFASLSPDDQAMIQAAVDNAVAWGDEETINGEAKLLETLKVEGMEVIEPDKDAFRELAQTSH